MHLRTFRRLAGRAFLFLIVLAAAATAFAGIAWTTVAPLPTNHVGLTAVTALNGKIYAMSGYPENCCGGVPLSPANEAYDPGTGTWATMAPIPSPRSLGGAALAQDGKIYVIGGYVDGIGYSGVVEAYSPSTDSWSGRLATMPTNRYELSVVAAGVGVQERLYAMGGFNNGAPAIATVEAYNPVNDTWTTVAPLPEPRRGMAAVRGPDGLIYAIGGTPNVLGQPAATVFAYNPATNSWSTRSPMPLARGYHTAAVGGDGLIYVMGGNFSIPTVHVYNPVTDTWATGPSMPSARSGLAAATSHDGRVFAMGGTGGGTRTDVLVLSGAAVTPSSLSFGNQEVGTPSAALAVTFTSDGTLPYIPATSAIGGVNPTEFVIAADSCIGQTLAPGDACSISVGFNPAGTGSRAASLIVTDNSALQSQTIPLSGSGVITDANPPVLTLPADISANAESALGVTVSYVVTAVDPEGSAVTLSCSPTSGSLFPIGTTTVSCTASDARGNTSTGSFHVRVKGADDQLADLIAHVQSLNLQQGIANSLDAKLANAQSALAAARAGNLAVACNLLSAFINEVQAQTDNKITAAQAAELIAAGNRIKSVLGCP